jgi:hypothetical protein
MVGHSFFGYVGAFYHILYMILGLLSRGDGGDDLEGANIAF